MKCLSFPSSCLLFCSMLAPAGRRIPSQVCSFLIYIVSSLPTLPLCFPKGALLHGRLSDVSEFTPADYSLRLILSTHLLAIYTHITQEMDVWGFKCYFWVPANHHLSKSEKHTPPSFHVNLLFTRAVWVSFHLFIPSTCSSQSSLSSTFFSILIKCALPLAKSLPYYNL